MKRTSLLAWRRRARRQAPRSQGRPEGRDSPPLSSWMGLTCWGFSAGLHCGWEGTLSCPPPPPLQTAWGFLNCWEIVFRRSLGGEKHIPLEQHHCQAQHCRMTKPVATCWSHTYKAPQKLHIGTASGNSKSKKKRGAFFLWGIKYTFWFLALLFKRFILCFSPTWKGWRITGEGTGSGQFKCAWNGCSPSARHLCSSEVATNPWHRLFVQQSFMNSSWRLLFSSLRAKGKLTGIFHV